MPADQTPSINFKAWCGANAPDFYEYVDFFDSDGNELDPTSYTFTGGVFDNSGVSVASFAYESVTVEGEDAVKISIADVSGISAGIYRHQTRAVNNGDATDDFMALIGELAFKKAL